MIYINVKDQKVIDGLIAHQDGLLFMIKNRVNNCIDIDIQAFLTEANLITLLTGLPDDILNLNNRFYQTLPGFSLSSYNNFKIFIDIDKKKRTRHQKALVTKYTRLHTIIENIFKYEKSFSLKKTKYSTYNLANILDINTCVYCNRMYTKTVIKPKKITRPEFDHWFPKSKYPLLALSFYNLIPSCHVCNSSLKGATNLNLTDYFHPYIDDEKTINREIKFSYYNKTLDTYGFNMITPNSRGQNTIDAFKIKEIYETHEEEIAELRKIRDIYSESYLQKLSSLYKGIISPEEVYRLAFGVYIEESKFEKRPLSKMKRDILIELGIIKDEK